MWARKYEIQTVAFVHASKTKLKLNYTQFVGKYTISVRVTNLILSHFQAK